MIASPSGSDELVPLKLTAVPSTPEYGPPVAAVGGWFVAVTVTGALAIPAPPSLSVTITNTVSVPAAA